MSEILKSVWARLYAWAFPSALALAYFWFLVYPETFYLRNHIAIDLQVDGTIVFATATAAMATCLSALSNPLYRILEGYLLWPKWLQKACVKRQLRIKKAYEAASQSSESGWSRGLELEENSRYPMRDDQIVPSKFGNAIRAFETYGKTRFNLDSQTLWHELYSVSSKDIQEKIEEARSSVDFFVAGTYLSLFLAVVTLIIALVEGYDRTFLFLSLVPFLVMLVCHGIAIRAIDEWAYAVQALVNLGRVKLAESLGLSLPDTLEKEREMWGLTTKFVFYGNVDAGLSLDRFRMKPKAKEAPGQEISSEREETAQDFSED